MADKIMDKAVSDLTGEELAFCHNLYLEYYREEYAKNDPKTLEFNLDNLEDWVTLQLKDKIGERCLISNKGFLSFSVLEDYIDIFQFGATKEMAANITGSASFIKELGKRYPKKTFRSAIRKTQKDKALMYGVMGCKVTEIVNVPGFSSDYYLGVEMPSRFIRTLSMFIPSKK